MDSHTLHGPDEVFDVVAALSWGAPSGLQDRIGLEQEFFVVDVESGGRPVGRTRMADVAEVLDTVAEREPGHPTALTGWALPDGSRLLLEPGAQVEHATVPCGNVDELLRSARSTAVLLADAFAARSRALVAAGVDRWHPAEAVPQQLSAPRYPAMASYLRSRSPHGHLMMVHTASLQLNLDLGGVGEAARERWLVAHAAAPLAVATFSTSPAPGLACARVAAWRWLDPTRTGVPAALTDATAEPLAVLTAAALDADVLLVNRGGFTVPGQAGWSFRAWLADGHPDHGPPTRADLAYHLTTLFHEVRTRRFLEIRSIDALPARWRAVPIVLYIGLLYDPQARARARAVLERHVPRLAALLERALHLGVADPELCAMAVEVWTLAAEGARRLGADVVASDEVGTAEAFLDRFTLRGRSPGDELRELAPDGDAATLAWSTEPVTLTRSH